MHLFLRYTMKANSRCSDSWILQEGQHPLTGQRVRGRVEPWLMARWKARVELLLSVLNFFFYLLQLRRYKAKCVKTRCLQEGVGNFEPRFQGKGSSVCQYIDTTRKVVDCTITLLLQFFIYWNFAADFSSCIVKIVQKTTNLGTLSPS